MEEELRGSAWAEVAQGRVKEHQERAAEGGLKRAKSSLEEAQRRDGETVGMDDHKPGASSSSGSSAGPALSSNDSGGAARMDESGDGVGSNLEGRRRKAANIQRVPERADGKWMRVERNKRKTEEEEGRMKTVKYLKTFERLEAKKGWSATLRGCGNREGKRRGGD